MFPPIICVNLAECNTIVTPCNMGGPSPDKCVSIVTAPVCSSCNKMLLLQLQTAPVFCHPSAAAVAQIGFPLYDHTWNCETFVFVLYGARNMGNQTFNEMNVFISLGDNSSWLMNISKRWILETVSFLSINFWFHKKLTLTNLYLSSHVLLFYKCGIWWSCIFSL